MKQSFNIASESHSVHNNIDNNFGAIIGAKYVHEFNQKGIKFWVTPKGVLLESGRLARSFETQSYLYKRGVSPSPVITYYHGGTGTGQAWKISTINGYNVTQSGDYFTSFQNLCDRLWVGQNAFHYVDANDNKKLNIGTGQWLRPAKVLKSDVMSLQKHYQQRPWVAPTMPYSPQNLPQDFPIFQTKRGISDWVNNGWAYKKENARYNSNSQHDFDWEIGSGGEWENDDIWDVPTNPAANVDKNLLYLMQKHYSHGPNCNGTHDPFTARNCNDRILVGYRSHYWVKDNSVPQHFSPDNLLFGLFNSDLYPYNPNNEYRRRGWPPYSVSGGSTPFDRYRVLSHRKPTYALPWYAKQETSSGMVNVIDNGCAVSYKSLCEVIPANTAFDLVVMVQTIGYAVWKRKATVPAGYPPGPPYPYYEKVYPIKNTSTGSPATAYFNSICHCLFHQIAPLPPKP